MKWRWNERKPQLQRPRHGVLAEAARRLKTRAAPSARLDAEILLAHCLRWRPSGLPQNPERPLSESERQPRRSVARRLRGSRWRISPDAKLSGPSRWRSPGRPHSPTGYGSSGGEALAVSRLQPGRAAHSGCRHGQRRDCARPRRGAAGRADRRHGYSAAALAFARRNARALGLAGGVTFLEATCSVRWKNFRSYCFQTALHRAAEYETLPAGVKNYDPGRRSGPAKQGGILRKIDISGTRKPQGKGWLLLENARSIEPAGRRHSGAGGLLQDITNRADNAVLTFPF